MPRSSGCSHASRLILMVGLLFSSAVWAQQSSIVGTVTDSTGAVISGVTVTSRNLGTGEIRESTTNDVGQYAIPNLRTGSYEVTASKQGFQKKSVEQVALEVQ